MLETNRALKEAPSDATSPPVPSVVVVCFYPHEESVGGYITYRLSYRDLVAMMAERGTRVSHTTILRWVIRYVPEFEKRWNRWARRTNSSWRVDETYIRVRGKWHFLYRAVDKYGKTIDFLLRADRGTAAAQAFFRKALNAAITVSGIELAHRIRKRQLSFGPGTWPRS